jgi:hypothetical protein
MDDLRVLTTDLMRKAAASGIDTNSETVNLLVYGVFLMTDPLNKQITET